MIRPATTNGRNWRVTTSITAPAGPVGSTSRVSWRRKCATAEGQQQQADEDDEQPALDPDARAEPAPRPAIGGPTSCPVELAVEDRDRPAVLLRAASAASSSAITIER